MAQTAELTCRTAASNDGIGTEGQPLLTFPYVAKFPAAVLLRQSIGRGGMGGVVTIT